MEFNQINLTTRDHVDRRILYSVLGTVLALLAIFTILNAVNGIQAFRERRDYRAKIEDLQQQAKALNERENDVGGYAPDAAEDLSQRSRHANYLIALDVFPWIAILDALENTIPPQVVLERFVPAADLKSIRITGLTPSMEPITQFQDALGKSTLFQSVVLENMDLGAGGAAQEPAVRNGNIYFEMICHIDFKTLFPQETYGALWIVLASSNSGTARKR